MERRRPRRRGPCIPLSAGTDFEVSSGEDAAAPTLHKSCTQLLKLCGSPPRRLQVAPLLLRVFERPLGRPAQPLPAFLPGQPRQEQAITMTSIPFAPPAIPFSLRGALVLAGAAVAVTALADFLFYQHAPGVSVAVFAAALGVAALVTNRLCARWTTLAAAPIVLAAALAPAVEDFSLLSLAFAVTGVCVFVLMAAGWAKRPAAQRLTDVVWMVVSGPFRLAADLGSAATEARQQGITKHGVNWLVAWIVPAGLGGLFLVLFAQANPLIEHWFREWLTGGPHNWRLDLARPLFWLAAAALIWPFLRVRVDDKPVMKDVVKALDQALSDPVYLPHESAKAALPDAEPVAEPAEAGPAETTPDNAAPVEGPLFGRTAILRSLVLFNALFAVQTALDVTYLWGGLALPVEMTYATYAHRGAYPLIVTALMAGGFVLAAMRPGSGAARCRLARALVYLWSGQTVLLVLSSILRLDLYVEAYSLTEWRCAAFVWMLLVAAGLVLIMVRIMLDLTNRWLVAANAAVLAIALYACSLIDFSGVIARFNVTHSREIAGAGQPVDVAYLCRLGPAALPALDVLAKAKADANGWLPQSSLFDCRPSLEQLHAMRMADWRAWTFRGYRLNQYLEGNLGPRASRPLFHARRQQNEAGGPPAVPDARALSAWTRKLMN
jgi:Domain of unknown function (DUF4173)